MHSTRLLTVVIFAALSSSQANAMLSTRFSKIAAAKNLSVLGARGFGTKKPTFKHTEAYHVKIDFSNPLGSRDFFDYCYRNKINPNHLKMENNETTLIAACMDNNPDAVEKLLTFRDLSPNQADDQGNTALHYACMSRNHRIVEALLSHEDIDVNSLNNCVKSPLEVAIEVQRNTLDQGMDKCTRLLLEHPGICINGRSLAAAFTMSTPNIALIILNRAPLSLKHILYEYAAAQKICGHTYPWADQLINKLQQAQYLPRCSEKE